MTPPSCTADGIAAAPAVETEDSTFSGAATVFNIEFPAGYAEQKVEISSPQLYGQCQGHLTWAGADEAILGTGNSVSATLDDNGNAFVVVLAGPSCTTGTSEVTAKLLAGPQPTVQTSFKILSPSPAPSQPCPLARPARRPPVIAGTGPAGAAYGQPVVCVNVAACGGRMCPRPGQTPAA
jgi:hypothetical protein